MRSPAERSSHYFGAALFPDPAADRLALTLVRARQPQPGVCQERPPLEGYLIAASTTWSTSVSLPLLPPRPSLPARTRYVASVDLIVGTTSWPMHCISGATGWKNSKLKENAVGAKLSRQALSYEFIHFDIYFPAALFKAILEVRYAAWKEDPTFPFLAPPPSSAARSTDDESASRPSSIIHSDK